MGPRGIREQTREFFEVCRLSDVRIITFINELDREGTRSVRSTLMIL